MAMNTKGPGAPSAGSTGGQRRYFSGVAWLAVALAFGVIVFGAFVRLSNAGLSCPDWPTCYGRATWPRALEDGADHVASLVRAVDPSRAWREQLHRHLAAALGTLVLILAVMTARRHRRGLPTVIGAASLVALSIPLYMRGATLPALLIAGVGELTLLSSAWRWRGDALAGASALTLAVIVFQALLGMWTVTWLLKPIVVTAHLLGGLTTYAMLLWMAWRSSDRPLVVRGAGASLRAPLLIGLALLGVQLALGGWTSANYAALSCGTDYPKCAGAWWPTHNFSEAFVLWRGVGVDYEGGVLDGPSRVAIQMTHRIVAVVVFAYVLWLARRLRRRLGGGWSALLIGAICLQVCLGIANVWYALPLGVAVAHNAGAALLLALFVTMLARLDERGAERTPPRHTTRGQESQAS